MRIEAIGLPIYAAAEEGLISHNEPLAVEHVPSGHRLVAKLKPDGTVITLHGAILLGCVTIAAGPVTFPPPRKEDGNEPPSAALTAGG